MSIAPPLSTLHREHSTSGNSGGPAAPSAFKRLRRWVQSQVRPLITFLPRWWYGALIPEWPGFFVDDPRSIARYVSPKATQWLPMVIPRHQLEASKRNLRRLQNELGDLESAYAEGASAVLERQLAQLTADVEDTRREMRNLRIKMAQVIYETLANLKPCPIRYTLDPYSAIRVQQAIRSPGEVIESLLQGTCVDLAVLFCGLCLSQKLLPMVILLRDPVSGERHALAAVSLDEDVDRWDAPDRFGRLTISENQLQSPIGAGKLAEWVKNGRYLAVECTGFSHLEVGPGSQGRIKGFLSFNQAVRLGEVSLEDPRRFLYALDVATAQNAWGLSPFEPRMVFGERRLAQTRRKRNVVAAALLILMALFAYCYTITYRQVDDLEKRILSTSDPVAFAKEANTKGLVAWLTSDRLKARLAGDLGPHAYNASSGDYLKELGHARQRSRAAVGLFLLTKKQDRSALDDVLGGSTPYHPQARTATILNLANLPSECLNSDEMAGWIKDPKVANSDRLRQAIVLTVGRSARPLSKSVVTDLKVLFQSDRDPGVHSAADWALREGSPADRVHWIVQQSEAFRNQGIGRFKKEKLDPKLRQWFVDTKTGLTMVYFPPGETYEIGDLRLDRFDQDFDWRTVNQGELATRVRAKLTRGFALATIETPRGVYDGEKYPFSPSPSATPGRFHDKRVIPTSSITWTCATVFCNSLNNPGGPFSYQVREVCGSFTKVTQVELMEEFPNFSYRLPTEAEWEYAARGSSLDPFSFGVDPTALKHYAYTSSRTGPVARCMPNDFGLFDVHGGVEEWCDDRDVYRDPDDYRKDPLPSHRPLVVPNDLTPYAEIKRICRGGSRSSPPGNLSVFRRHPLSQAFGADGAQQGFRLAFSIDESMWWIPSTPPSR